MDEKGLSCLSYRPSSRAENEGRKSLFGRVRKDPRKRLTGQQIFQTQTSGLGSTTHGMETDQCQSLETAIEDSDSELSEPSNSVEECKRGKRRQSWKSLNGARWREIMEMPKLLLLS